MCVYIYIYIYIHIHITIYELYVPTFPSAGPLSVSVFFFYGWKGFVHRQPRVGSPQPQEEVPRPAGVRHLYKWNLYSLPIVIWISEGLTQT